MLGQVIRYKERGIVGTTLTAIFGKFVHDKKWGTCQHIDNVDEVPFIKRCPKRPKKGTRYCEEHSE